MSEAGVPREDVMAAEAAGGWDAIARAAGARDGGAAEQEALRELLVFVLDGASYAIPVARVREIVRMRPVIPVPRVPREVRGVIALRGEVVQVVDLRMRLSLSAADATRSTRIIVLHGDDDRVTGVWVDAVHEVMRIPEADIRSADRGDDDAGSELFLSGDEFVSIMNLDRALDLHAVR